MPQVVVAPSLVAVAPLADLPPGQPHGLTVDDVQLVAIHMDGQVRLYEGRCAHQGTLLGEGSVEGNELVCRAHGWRYDVATGVRTGHPAICLQPFTATVQDGQVWVDRDAIAAWRRRSAAPAAAATPAKLRTLADLPGPKRLPVLGNLHQIDVPTLHQLQERWCAEYGPIFRFDIGPRVFVGIGDPELVQQVLRERPDIFRRVDLVEPVFKEMNLHGVFSAESEEWRRYRKLATEALSNRHLRQFFPTMHMVLGRLQQRWNKSAGQPVDVQKDLMRFTVDVTTNLAFGIDLNTVEDADNAVQRHLEKVFPMLARRLNFPFPYWRYFQLGPDRELDKALKALKTIMVDLVTKTRQRMADNPELFQHPTNFLEAMLVVQAQGEDTFADEEILGNVATLLGAGEAPPANSIAWMLDLLCRHPHVLAKLRAEVDAVLGDAAQLSDFKLAEKLVYLEAVTHETMRIKSVAPLNYLQPTEDVVLGDVLVPKGTAISTVMRSLSLSAEHFADPLAFRPERWLDAAPLSPHHPNVSMPFGSGPRLCPGRSLALLEIKAAMAMIVRNFDIAHAGHPDQVTEVFAFTMMPKNLLIRFSPRPQTA